MKKKLIAYPNKNLQLLVVLQLIFVEADAFIVVTAENTVTLNHSFSHCTWKLTHKKNKNKNQKHKSLFPKRETVW